MEYNGLANMSMMLDMMYSSDKISWEDYKALKDQCILTLKYLNAYSKDNGTMWSDILAKHEGK